MLKDLSSTLRTAIAIQTFTITVFIHLPNLSLMIIVNTRNGLRKGFGSFSVGCVCLERASKIICIPCKLVRKFAEVKIPKTAFAMKMNQMMLSRWTNSGKKELHIFYMHDLLYTIGPQKKLVWKDRVYKIPLL